MKLKENPFPHAPSVLWGLKEIANYLGISISTVSRWYKYKGLFMWKASKKYMITTTLLDRWLTIQIQKELKEKLRLKRIEERQVC